MIGVFDPTVIAAGAVAFILMMFLSFKKENWKSASNIDVHKTTDLIFSFVSDIKLPFPQLRQVFSSQIAASSEGPTCGAAEPLSAKRANLPAEPHQLPLPPRPWALPIVGNMVQLGMKDNPYECMTDMSRRLGPVFGLRLGSTNAVVVNDYNTIREVLIKKGDHFDARPDFRRYNELFGGDRDNSLALCDWSRKQVSRRNVARYFMHVRAGTDPFQLLNEAVCAELPQLLNSLTASCKQPVEFKQIIQLTCCNIFCQYLCTRKFSHADKKFQKLVRNFDEIFWDINLGYAMDFIDWARIFRLNVLNYLRRLADDIRDIIYSEIIEPHKEQVDYENPKDFVDFLLKRMKYSDGNNETITEVTALYELEDFLGGHSAVGNIIMQALTQVALNPDVQNQVHCELDEKLGDRDISLDDRFLLPYTEGVLLEALRVCSSPIVPHVASRDSSVSGFRVPRGTVVFINNYELNTSTAYWEEPERFNPSRFVKNGVVVRPPHFLPFSTGKRSCMGSRMLTNVAFTVLAAVLSRFSVHLPSCASDLQMQRQHMQTGRLALPVETFRLVFNPRKP